MKMFLGDIVRSKEVFDKLLNMDVSIKLALKIKIMYNSIQPFLVEYEEAKNKLIKKHGKPSEDGASTSVIPNTPEWFDFVNEMNEIASSEYEITTPLLGVDEIGKEENIKLSAKDLLKFDTFMEKTLPEDIKD